MVVRQPLVVAILSTLALPCITLQHTETNVQSKVTGPVMSHNKAVAKKRNSESRNTIKTTMSLQRHHGSTLDASIQLSEMLGNLELENKIESKEEYFCCLSNRTGQVAQPPIVSSYPILNLDIDIETLNICDEDRNNDSQCRGNLVCKNNPSTTIPGCSGIHDSYAYDFFVANDDYDTKDSAFVGKVILVDLNGN
eukprot:5088606-Ditylum_brightwellii.AAC.1